MSFLKAAIAQMKRLGSPNLEKNTYDLRLGIVLFNEVLPLFDGKAPYRLLVVDMKREGEVQVFGDFCDVKTIEGIPSEERAREVARATWNFMEKYCPVELVTREQLEGQLPANSPGTYAL